MKRLYRSRTNKMIAGVCGGIAEYLGIDTTIVRLLYIVASLMLAAFPGLLIYIIAIFVIPYEGVERL